MQVPSVWNLQIPTLSLVVGTSWVLAIDQAGVVCRSLFSWCFTLDCLVSSIHFNEYSVKKSNLSKNSLILCGLISEIYTLRLSFPFEQSEQRWTFYGISTKLE